MTKEEYRFLWESNAIEREYGPIAFEDAVETWQIQSQEPIEVTAESILRIHRLLMRRLNPGIAGRLREVDVWVGGRKGNKPAYLRADLVDWVEKYGRAKTETAIKAAHIAFEKIHPFEDGNGRAGRIIMNLQRVRAGLPILIIHEGEEQYRYYDWFR